MQGNVVIFTGVDAIRQQAVPKPWAPLSILTIGSYLAAHGYEAVLIDPQVHDDWEARIAAEVPGAVYLGVSCMTGPSINNVLRAIRIAREADPLVPIVWGGYHATLRYQSIVREALVDAVVRGPGEPAALELAMLYERHSRTSPEAGKALHDIPNIAFADHSGAGSTPRVHATRTARMFDINDLPPCDYGLLSPVLYYTAQERKIPYVSSYGCPHACTYCSEPTNSGRRWRGLAPDRIVREARQLVERYEPDILDFMDPNFSSDPRRVVAFVEELEAAPLPLKFMANMRTRDVVMIMNSVSMERLAAVGFTRIFLGIESGSDRVLSYLDKKATNHHTLDACQALADAGIETWASFMHDLPTETIEESEMTLELAEKLMRLPGNYQSHHFYMPFPDTQLFLDHFGDVDVDSMRQEQWATSSTKGSVLWRGRPEFRERITARLTALRRLEPEVFGLTNLPGD